MSSMSLPNHRQELEEPVQSFITSLYTLAEHCGYDTLHIEMIRDRITIGIQVLEKIQLDPILTLDKVIANIHQAEAVNR